MKTKRTTATSAAIYRWVHRKLVAVIGEVNEAVCIHVWATSCQWMGESVPAVEEIFRLCVCVHGTQYVSEGSLQKAMRKFLDDSLPKVAAHPESLWCRNSTRLHWAAEERSCLNGLTKRTRECCGTQAVVVGTAGNDPVPSFYHISERVRNMDRYDKAIKYLVANPRELDKVWSNADFELGGCLFSYCTPSRSSVKRPDGRSCGCLTMVHRSGASDRFYVAWTDELTSGIAGDNRLHGSLAALEREILATEDLDERRSILEPYAAWQRKMDSTIRQPKTAGAT